MENLRKDLALRLAQVRKDPDYRKLLHNQLEEDLHIFRLFATYLANSGIQLQLLDYLYEKWAKADVIAQAALELITNIAPIASAPPQEAIKLIITHSAGIDQLAMYAEDLDSIPADAIPTDQATDAAEDLLHHKLNTADFDTMRGLLQSTID